MAIKISLDFGKICVGIRCSLRLDDCTLMHKRSYSHRNADKDAYWADGHYDDTWMRERVDVKELKCGPRLIPESPTVTHDLNGQQPRVTSGPGQLGINDIVTCSSLVSHHVGPDS
jgi:hypothetical protein